MQLFKTKISKEEVDNLPVKSFNGKIHLIDHPKDADRLAEYLKQFPVLGFDTETRPVFKKNRHNSVALLQLAVEDEAFLIRLNKTGLSRGMADILGNPDIVKSGVAIRDDIKELRRLKSFKPGGFVELQQFVSSYGIEDAGLKKLTANILGFRISKSEQLSNWERFRLSEKQKKYAATDAWVGFLIYKKLIEKSN